MAKSSADITPAISKPRVIMLAGPNGAGKTTAAAAVLQGPMRVDEFVNADWIAQGLSAFAPDRVARAAGRQMLVRLQTLARQRVDFAFETTLAGRSYARWLATLLGEGYELHLLYLWLPSVELAIARVASRVRAGGHDIPEAVIRRRYWAGIRNFLQIYRPLATTWRILHNGSDVPRLVAEGSREQINLVADAADWELFLASAT